LNGTMNLLEAADVLTVEYFYESRHQYVWDGILECHRLGVSAISHEGYPWVNSVMLVSTLDKNTVLMMGGLAYLSELETYISVMSCNYYIPLLKKAKQLRDLYVVGQIIQNKSSVASDATQAINVALQMVEDLDEGVSTGDLTPRQMASATMKMVEQMYHGNIESVEFGIQAIDSVLILQSPDVMYLPARPSVGKTALMLQIMRHMCGNLRKHVGCFSLEMTYQQLLMRWISSMSGASTDDMRRKAGLKEDDLPRITHACEQISNFKFNIEDQGGLTVGDVRAKARAWKKEHDTKLFIVDYFQLVRGNTDADNREQELAEVSRQLKEAAKETETPWLVLAQMNRNIELRRTAKNPNPVPLMSDIRETGQVEQDADNIAFLVKVFEDADTETNDRNLVIRKQRMGEAPVTVPLHFCKKNQTFEAREWS
jgi:replicative DNA helicase